MKTIDEIRTQLSLGRFEFSRHAFKRTVERNISEFEIRQAGGQATIIEDYPDDKYTSSCLLLGLGSQRLDALCISKCRMWTQTC